MVDNAERLNRAIEAKEARIGVIGLGYVGLPLALAFTGRGFRVLGFDVDARKVEQLNRGVSYIPHMDAQRIRGEVDSGRLAATEDFDRLSEVDAIVICVPTPLDVHHEPDMTYIVATTEEVARHLRPGQLVVLESTTYPGTTDELMRERLEAGGLMLGEDFFLAFSPEREDPGNPKFSTTTIPKVVGGVDEISGNLAETLYRQAIGEVVRVSSVRAAKATKLTENIFRAVNIALVNELKVIYEKMGIDVWEVLDAAETKPFGFMRFNPGPGWGGHCIPLDPFYLSWKARESGVAPKFIELAGEVNIAMPDYVVGKLASALNDRERALKNSRILVLGIAYKRDISDPRESPAFEIIERLLHTGAHVSYHDPHVPKAPRMRTWPELPQMVSLPLTEETLRGQHAVILITDHTDVDYALVERAAPLIVDTRGKFPRDLPHVVRA